MKVAHKPQVAVPVPPYQQGNQQQQGMQVPPPMNNGNRRQGNGGDADSRSFIARLTRSQGTRKGLPVSQTGFPYHDTPSQADRVMVGVPLAGTQPPAPSTADKSSQRPEVENGNLILHRSRRFFVRTAYRPGQRRNPLHNPAESTTIFFRSVLEQMRWLSAEKERVADAGTRLLPNPEPINLRRTKAFPVPAWLEVLVVVLGLMVTLVAHAYNMFSFPLYEQDEGTYMSSAWAIVHGMLQPYAYRYDHPPLGWIQIAGWVQITGGFFAFGNAINSGRVLMLLFAIGCSLLIYLIARRLSGSRSTALLALVIFSLSPLSITYQRLVLLDNIGTFWILLSLYLLVVGNSRLFFIVSAAISFSIAALSKEIFLIYLPVMLYAVWLHSTTFQRKFALVAFTYVAITLSSTFILLAILKGELLPTGWLPWDTHPHVSLIGTLITQVQRTQSEGSLVTSWNAWAQSDLVLLVLSVAATCINLVAGWWNRRQWLLALFAISFVILLIRGGVVFPYYIIPLIPFMALNIAFAANTLVQWMRKYVALDLARVVLVLGIVAAIVPYDLLNAGPVYTQHPASAQVAALQWIRTNVPHNAVLIINNYLYTDLHEVGGEGVDDGATYPYANDYLNVAYDPALHDVLLQGDWNRVDYIIADSSMLHDIKTLGGSMLFLDRALHHADLRAEFRAANGTQQEVIQIYQVIHSPAPVLINHKDLRLSF